MNKIECQNKIVNNRIEEQYWIDRLGKIHKWKDKMLNGSASYHYAIAHKLFPKVQYPKDYLFKIGWMAVGYMVDMNEAKKIITQAQLNKLNELGFYSYSLDGVVKSL